MSLVTQISDVVAAIRNKINLMAPRLAPTGGTTGQVLTKASATANDFAWSAPAVSSVAGRTGAITLTSADVGLGNVNNTSDANKPISTAAQTALNLKASKYSTSIGDGSTLSYTVTHGLGTTDVVVGLKDSTGLNVIADVTTATANTVTVAFKVAPASSSIRVTVLG